MSKSELRRKCVVNPLDMADRLHEFEQENEKLKADVAMLLEELKFYADGKHYYEEMECFGGQCVVKEFGHKAKESLSATASSDAWLNEQKAKVLEEYLLRLRAIPSIGLSERQFGELRMAAELRNSESGTGQPSRTA
jgi:hypothetical protein